MPKRNLEPKKVSDSTTILTELVMPNDTNPLHNLMGGNLMRWMDIAASISAGKHCEAQVVTVSVDYVSFKHPIPMGSVITLRANVTRSWNTSVETYVEVYSADVKGKNNRMCNTAFLTFVALDEDNKKPIKVPTVEPLSAEEQKLYEGAQRRRELRLILGGRIKPEEATNLKALFTKE